MYTPIPTAPVAASSVSINFDFALTAFVSLRLFSEALRLPLFRRRTEPFSELENVCELIQLSQSAN